MYIYIYIYIYESTSSFIFFTSNRVFSDIREQEINEHCLLRELYVFEGSCKIRVHHRHRERAIESLWNRGMPQVRDVILRASRSEENRSALETAGFSMSEKPKRLSSNESILNRPVLRFCLRFFTKYNIMHCYAQN